MGAVGIITIIVIVGSLLVLAYVHLRTRRDKVARGQRNLDYAMVQLTKQVKRNPSDVTGHAKLGIIYLKKGDARNAMEHLSRAIEIDPIHVEARYHRGLAFMQAGQRAAAEKDFQYILDHSEDAYFKTAARNGIAKLKSGGR